MAFPGSIYAPPGVYTETSYDTPEVTLASILRIPLFIGVGSEILTQSGLEMVRGSSGNVDQQVVSEDETGRAVLSISDAGAVSLTAFNGVIDRIQVRNYPIVSGDGSGTTATSTGAVSVTINDVPVVVLSMNAALGVLQLSTPPALGDDVRVTYFFKRTDTQITDDLSDQVTEGSAKIYGEIGQSYSIEADVNDGLSFLVDAEDTVTVTISESPVGGWTAAQVAAFINSAATGTSLVASAAVNNFGSTVVLLSADRSIKIQSGTANSTFGFTSGTVTARNAVFYTFQRPIVDGSNGGITTTDPSDVTVTVDGVAVTPTALDGATGAVTLPFAPEDGAEVLVTYYFNAWQDTFDYLLNLNVTEITQCGLTSDRDDYTAGADFVLKDDRILWGAASIVATGETAADTTAFSDVQITSTLVDTRQYMAVCSGYVNTSVSPPVESRQVFTLPLQPTTGNGRNTPLSSATFEKVANGRVQLPTNRPDLVWVYWGFSLSDALERGRVAVTKVDSSTNRVTLAEPVPVGATVYATFYYSTLQDQDYTITSVSEGASGIGTYSIQNEAGSYMLTPTYGTKSAGLSTITIQFPSGTERLPDCRFESPFTTSLYEGPVEEVVTVTFAALAATVGSYTVPASGPYYMVSGASDHFDVEVDGSAVAGGFVDLNDPTGVGAGFCAQMVGDAVVYDADTGGATFAIDTTNNEIALEIDGVLVQSKVATGDQTLAAWATALNRDTLGDFAAATAGSTSTATLAATASEYDDYYVGWTIRMTSGSAAGDSRTISAYNGTTKVATVSTNFSAAVANTDTYHLFNPDTRPVIKSATRFLSPVTIAAGDYDALVLNYTGSTTGSTAISCTGARVIAAATYANAAALATAVQTAIDASIAAAGIDVEIDVGTDSSGRLTFTLTLDPTDTTGGFLEFVTGASVAVDFAVLAGLDTDTAQNGQAKLINSAIARRITVGSAPLLYDRLVLRNRLMPGHTGSLNGADAASQGYLKCLGGVGASLAGLTANDIVYPGLSGAMLPPTLRGIVGMADGQVAAGTYSTASDGQPIVTLYGAGGTNAQNNVFRFTFQGTAVAIEFTDAAGAAIASGGSAEVPLGPVSGVAQATILKQIQTAMTAAGITGTVVQEGAAIRFVGDSVARAASIIIGSGSANDVLGFSSGQTAYRTEVTPGILASALMAHSASTIAASINAWASPTTTYFAREAIAKEVTDEANAGYLFLQSQGTAGLGTASSIAIAVAAATSVTLPGTGLGVIGGEGGTGEDAVDGFYVTSTDAISGSGTANTSVLNSGVGQDGYVGQTYRDLVTGLTFTILPASGGASYPAGATVTFNVRQEAITDANLYTNAIPGIQLTVANTVGVAAGNTAVVSTYDSGGSEPTVGDIYYVSYNYRKSDFTTKLYTKLDAVVNAYGAVLPNNPVSLASYLAIQNGATVVAIKQVPVDTDGDGDGVNDSASVAAFLSALSDVEGPMPGGAYPDNLTALKTGSTELNQAIALHCDVQSDIRHRANRTAIMGMAAGTVPTVAGANAQAVGRSRFRFVYPDIYTVKLTNALARSETFVVDGSYAAAAVSGGRCSPAIDVATPWTNSDLFGLASIARVLSEPERNQVASYGVTVITNDQSRIYIRQGLTTDMSNYLTKTPTVNTIADEVERTTRSVLARFAGVKAVAGITTQVEGQLSKMFRSFQKDQIILEFVNPVAAFAEDDPTTMEVTASYKPIKGLLYLHVKFRVQV